MGVTRAACSSADRNLCKLLFCCALCAAAHRSGKMLIQAERGHGFHHYPDHQVTRSSRTRGRHTPQQHTLREQRLLQQPRGLRHAQHHVQVLDRLPRRALDQVVDHCAPPHCAGQARAPPGGSSDGTARRSDVGREGPARSGKCPAGVPRRCTCSAQSMKR